LKLNYPKLFISALLAVWAIACDPAAPEASPQEPAAEPAAEPAVEPASEPTAEPASEPAAEPSPGVGEPTEQPAAAFASHSLRQEELRGVAMQAVQGGQNNLAIAALIALMETPELSGMRGSGMLMLAELYVQERIPESTERALGVLAALDTEFPPTAEFKFIYGRTLAEQARYEEAEPFLRAAVALRPDLLQSYMYLGSLLVDSGREEDAAAVYAQYEGVLAAMLQVLSSDQAELGQKLAVLESLGLATPDDRITEALVGLLASDEVPLAGAAVQVLAMVGTADALEPLQRFASETEVSELGDIARVAVAQIRMRER